MWLDVMTKITFDIFECTLSNWIDRQMPWLQLINEQSGNLQNATWTWRIPNYTAFQFARLKKKWVGAYNIWQCSKWIFTRNHLIDISFVWSSVLLQTISKCAHRAQTKGNECTQREKKDQREKWMLMEWRHPGEDYRFGVGNLQKLWNSMEKPKKDLQNREIERNWK